MKQSSFLLLILFSLLSACEQQGRIVSFPKENDIVDIPFHYSSNGDMIMDVVVAKDTFQFMIDSGSDISFISPSINSRKSYKKISIFDSSGIKHVKFLAKLDSMHLGPIVFKNFSFCLSKVATDSYRGIIGGDILQYFCMKIDNEKKIISLALKSDSIEKKGDRLTCARKNNTLFVKGLADNTEFDFLFDTGFNSSLLIDSINCDLLNQHTQTKWLNIHRLGFDKRTLQKPDTIKFVLADFCLGKRIFSNAIFIKSNKLKFCLMGTAFMRRFRTITIDYKHANIYFELMPDSQLFRFHEEQVKAVPLTYMNLIYSCFNSFGLSFTDCIPISINAIQDKLLSSPLQFGDTLIGINKQLVDEKYYNILNDTEKAIFTCLDSSSVPKITTPYIICDRKKATFHFLKKGNLVSIDLMRDTLIKSPPDIAYSFFGKKEFMGYCSINASISSNAFYYHIPWSTLSGKELQVEIWKNGKKTIHSNIPK